MSQSEPSNTLSFRRELPGIVIFFVVMVGSLYLSDYFDEPIRNNYGLHGTGPEQSPPWYFITRDFADGFGALIGLSVCLVTAVFVWRWWPSYASMMVWMAILWHGGHIAQSWIIYQACPGLLDGQRTMTRWPTLDSYLDDKAIDRARSVIRWSAVLLAVVLPMADRLVRRKLNPE